MRRCRIAVVGGGPIGCLAGILLARAGHEVVLFEKRTRETFARPASGRSINLVVPGTTIEAMLDLGVDERLTESAVLLRGRVMHARNGALNPSAYEDRRSAQPHSLLYPSEQPFSIGRGTVGRLLLETAERDDRLTAVFGHRLVDADLEAGHMQFETAEGSSSTAEADVVIGADGAFSTVRKLMAEGPGHQVEVRQSGIRYCELEIGSGPGDGPLAPRHFHLWPRRGFLLIALPNDDESFTCTLFAAETSGLDLDALGDARKRAELFEREFPDLPGIVALSSETGDADPSHPLVTVRCRPWHRGRAVLVGDACHALLPFSGRGTAEGFADCTVLARCLEQEDCEDAAAAFEGYARQRKPVTDALADFSDALAPLLLAFLPESGLSARI